jgi:hypothetical protein
MIDAPSARVRLRDPARAGAAGSRPGAGDRTASIIYRVCGKPRSTLLVAGSGQRLVTAFVRV